MIYQWMIFWGANIVLESNAAHVEYWSFDWVLNRINHDNCYIFLLWSPGSSFLLQSKMKIRQQCTFLSAFLDFPERLQGRKLQAVLQSKLYIPSTIKSNQSCNFLFLGRSGCFGTTQISSIMPKYPNLDGVFLCFH